MASTTDAAQPTDDPGTEQSSSPRHQSSRLNQALAWVGIVAGGLFIVAGIFLSGYFLSYSEHMHMQMGMGHMAMGHEPMDCCSHMKPGDHAMKPGEMMNPGMMGPQSGR